MNTARQIKDHIDSHPEPKRSDLANLHQQILEAMPGSRSWFLDGKDEKGKLVTNPNIGYGSQMLKVAGGRTKEFYQVGISANTSGISVYILGLPDKKYLSETYGSSIGKARITGYCISFKQLRDVNMNVLLEAIKDGVAQTS